MGSGTLVRNKMPNIVVDDQHLACRFELGIGAQVSSLNRITASGCCSTQQRQFGRSGSRHVESAVEHHQLVVARVQSRKNTSLSRFCSKSATIIGLSIFLRPPNPTTEHVVRAMEMSSAFAATRFITEVPRRHKCINDHQLVRIEVG